MKTILRYKNLTGKGISLLALLLFTNSVLFAQVNKKAEKGSKHIKIEAEINGKKINVDTIIPAGADFDENAFLESLGLESHATIDMDSDENGFTYNYETKDGKKVKKQMGKEMEVEVETNDDGETIIKKRIYVTEGDGKTEKKIIKKQAGDEDKEVIIIKDGDVKEGNVKVIKKKMDGDNVIIIEEAEDGTGDGTNIWIEEDGKKRELKGDKNIIIIKEESDGGKTSTKKVWIDEDGKKHVIKEGDTVIMIKEEGDRKEKNKKKDK